MKNLIIGEPKIENNLPQEQTKNNQKFYHLQIEIEDFLNFRDALIRGIEEFNSKFGRTKSLNLKLINDASKYTLRIAKKTGQPNFDYPSILLTSAIKNCQFEKVSVVFDETHISSQTSSFSNPGNITNFSKESKDETFKNVPKRKTCCESCSII